MTDYDTTDDSAGPRKSTSDGDDEVPYFTDYHTTQEGH